MVKYLIIVESPSKCNKIQKYLSDLYKNHHFIVKASVGHISKLALSGKGRMGIDFDNNYEPNFIIDPKKKNVINDLIKESKNVDCVLIATDLDYEGAKIGYDIAKYLKLKLNENNRIIFNEITKNALKNAFENPQPIDMNMVYSQYARRVLDRLIGFELSKITAKKIQKGASAGRVLSATTQIIYDKDNELKNNNVNYFYQILGNFENNSYILNDCIFNKEYKYIDTKKIKSIFKKFQKSSFFISDIKLKDEFTNPAKPFITSTINQSSPYSIKKTSAILQKLYQKGLITYIRTDSHKMSEDAKNMIKKYIIGKFDKSYFKYRIFDTKKVKGSQEAHECIRPTNINKLPSNITNNDEKKIYKLIWERSIECLMESAKFKSKTITISASNINNIFNKKINYYYFLGYKILTTNINEINKDVKFFDNLNKNDKLKYIKIFSTIKVESNGSHYNESKLIKQLEKLGIGRPSTYAQTIDNIQNKYYVQKKNIDGIKIDVINLILDNNNNNNISELNTTEELNGEKNRLVITELGKNITNFLKENFPLIMDYNFTSNVETDLDNISNNKKIWYDVVDNYYKQIKPDINKIQKQIKDNKNNKKEKNLLIGNYNGKNFYKFISKWGPRIIYGELGDKSTLYLNIKKDKLLNDHTLQDAIDLLPKILGVYKNKNIILAESKSLYFKYDNKNYPLYYTIKNKQKNEITLDDAIFSIQEFDNKKNKKK